MTFTLALLLFSATPVEHLTVTPDLAKRKLNIAVTFDGWDGDCLCVDMGGEDALSGPARHATQSACFARPAKGPLTYTVDLAKLSRMRNDPDYAADLGTAWLFHDVAAFLHPDGVDTELHVRFVLPKGVSVATPWPQNPDGSFTISPAQFDSGAYVALGALRTLEDLKLDGFSARLTIVDEPKAASDEQLRAWVRGALTSLGKFYGKSPSRGERPIHIVLAGMPSDDAGVFGSVLRRKEPSVMLIYGTKATRGFETDWVATHELFHLGNPPTQGRYPWFVEGFTTYYTELLRARSKALPEGVVWGTLASSLREYCQPEGTTLLERSRDLARNHDWMRIYWAGACLALRVDVAIRVASKGARSLDGLLRELRKAEPLDEADLIAAFDQATGSDLASKHVVETQHLPIEALLRDLGVGAVKDDVALLDDKAPLAKVRQAMSRW